MASVSAFLKNHMTIRHMRLLMALEAHRSVIKAASYLNLTQPAISKALASLEGALGCPLFIRTKAGMTATETGAYLIKYSRWVLQRMELAERELEAIMSPGSSHISIGTLPTTAVYLIPDFVKRLETRLPNTTVSLREGTMDGLLPALRSGQIDFAVGLLTLSNPDQEFATDVLLEDPVVAVTRVGHPLTTRNRLTWEDLRGFPLVLPNSTTQARGAIEAVFVERGIPVTKTRVDSVSTMANVGTLQVTDAVGFMSRTLVKHFARIGVLEILPLDVPPTVKLSIGIVWIADRERTAAHLTCHQLMKETARDLSGA